MTETIPDLLNAASLLFAVLSVLYSIWYPEIRKACDTKVEWHKEDRGPAAGVVKHALWHRAWPLAAATLMLMLILTPAALQQLCASVRAARSGEGRYDAIGALFLGVYLLVIVLAVAAVRAVWRLHRVRSKLRGPSLPPPAG